MTRAEALAVRYARVARAEWSLEAAVQGATLVVNATPVGIDGDAVPVDPAFLDAGSAVFDLVYRRGETPWVHACRGRGLRASDGLPMLIEQGALAFERWFGEAPDRTMMTEACR
jgi:shikimate dehydrogenase